jgi:hypothetical protein
MQADRAARWNAAPVTFKGTINVQQIRQCAVTIFNGTALSTASADVQREQLVGVILPAGWDAAGITLQGSIDGQTWGNVFTASGELSFPSASCAPGNVLAFDAHLTPAIRFLKVRSGTSATPVNQTADRVVTLLTRDMVE